MSQNLNSESVKAVGFAFLSPEVVALISNDKRDKLFVYPPKKGKKFSLDVDESRRSVVLLRSPEKLSLLADFSDSIDLLAVFGKPTDLLDLGLPLMDAIVEDGKVEPLARQPRDSLLYKIDSECVNLILYHQEIEAQQPVEDSSVEEEEVVMPEEDNSPKTFVEHLRRLRTEVKKTGGSINFVEEVGAPAVLRVMSDLRQDEFKGACVKMVKDGGLDEIPVRDFYRWVEGRGSEGSGLELGRAVDALLYPDDDNPESSPEEIADRFSVDLDDLQFVANSYQQLVDSDD